MTLRPGSFAWLLAHDVRLAWRGASAMFGTMSTAGLAAVLVGGTILLHLIALPFVAWLSPRLFEPGRTSTLLIIGLGCTFSWMIAQGLFSASRTLYARGDLDLLLGSPLSPQQIFAAKAAGIAAGCFSAVALLTLPIANTGALTDHWGWLGIYPTLTALALIATSIGLALATAIFHFAGPARARLWTQMTGAVIAGTFVLGTQIAAMLPKSARSALSTSLDTAFAPSASGEWSLVRLPLEALLGDPLAAAILLAVSLTMFALVTWHLGHRFAAMSLAATSAIDHGQTRHRSSEPVRFHNGLARNLKLKEWRLLRRDPGMMAQLSLQIIYTIPVAVVLLRNEALPPVFALAPTIVVIAAQVAASLAWLTVSGEDAPELIATAPVSPSAVNLAKLHAIGMPLSAILVLPLLALASLSWHAALLTAMITAAAATSTALLNFWHPMPGNRRGMLRRHSQSKLIALLEHTLAMLWAVAMVLVLLDATLSATPIALALLVLVLMRSTARH